uniref:Uncharacterized protein n=1 Tax=Rhizophora mucronata TaxID=61149 RepID=A0A2P2NPB3_RHIMU
MGKLDTESVSPSMPLNRLDRRIRIFSC